MVDLIQVDPPCDQIRQALSDIPVVGSLISGDYTSTHVYGDQDFELFYEVLAKTAPATTASSSTGGTSTSPPATR